MFGAEEDGKLATDDGIGPPPGLYKGGGVIQFAEPPGPEWDKSFNAAMQIAEVQMLIADIGEIPEEKREETLTILRSTVKRKPYVCCCRISYQDAKIGTVERHSLCRSQCSAKPYNQLVSTVVKPY